MPTAYGGPGLSRRAAAVWCAGLIALGAMCPSAACANGADALLDEISAAVDANVALIQRGVARYRVVETLYRVHRVQLPRPGAPRVVLGKENDQPVTLGPFSTVVTVYFDYPKLRFQQQGPRPTAAGTLVEATDFALYDGQHKVHYMLGARVPRPGDYRVRIDAAPQGIFQQPHPIHPREQADGGWVLSSEFLAAARRNPERTLSAAEEGDLVRVRLTGPGIKTTCWLSRAHAYGVARVMEWRAKDPEEEKPYQVYEATFRRANNGAFVLEHRTRHEMFYDGDVRKPFRDEEVTLLDIDLRDELDPKVFMLDGLGLPAGAHIIDAVRGRNYEYGVPAVSEDEIATPEPTGALSAWHWLTAVFVLVGVAIACMLGLRHRKPLARNSGGNGGQ